MARAIALEKHSIGVQQQLETMQKTAEGLCKNEGELAVICAKDALREDLMRTHCRDMGTMEELARLQKSKARSEFKTWNSI